MSSSDEGRIGYHPEVPKIIDISHNFPRFRLSHSIQIIAVIVSELIVPLNPRTFIFDLICIYSSLESFRRMEEELL